MWSLAVFVILTTSWAAAQNGRGPRQSHHHGQGWDIRLAVPGEPGSDYPTLGAIPRTSFSCAGKEPGYYADLETNCQVFRICTAGSTYGFQSFLCPNGTLFNQAVFVCDWWMNVNCQQSQELFSSNNDKFGNLKLGPQLMKDIKKMLTHPMRNPYDKTVMKSNLIVMQDYRQPFGQMFPNGALIAGPERAQNSVYVPAKQQSFNQNVYSGNVFAASTPSPQYVPANFNTQTPSQRDAEVFQRQRQNGQYQNMNRNQNSQQAGNIIISNGQAGHLTQSESTDFGNGNSQISRTNQNFNQAQYTQKQSNFGSHFNSQNGEQINRQNAHYTGYRVPSQLNNEKQEFGVSFTKQQYNYQPNQQQEKQPYTNRSPTQLSNENTGQNNYEAKQNLVSDDVPATIVTKSLTFNRIVNPKPGNPKSRITFKTWLVKPSKAARLIAKPTPYTYDRPTNPPTEILFDKTTPYEYNPSTTISQTDKIVSESDGAYVYNKPTVAAKQILREPPRLYLTPTAAPSSAPPKLPSRLYLAPTTYKPAINLIIPSKSNLAVSRQYLAPSTPQQPEYYQSENLKAAPTSSLPVYVSPTKDNANPSFSLTKQSRINTNHNNLTFSDILTKEKLDITVNDIVSETSKVLKTSSPQQFAQYHQDANAVDYPEDIYLPPDSNNESDEKLTPQSPTVSTSARLVEDPSRNLEPPVETFNNNQSTNRLANLPFFKEPSSNTIERTVSLKISIPEKVANYLFKNRNESEYDKLEILSTGSSNYLVLTNNLLTKNNGASFIPIGRLIADKNSNISSHSQALVYSFLADSINAAKEYSNLAQQNSLNPTTQTQFQNVNGEDLARITNKISQLTASHYTANQDDILNHSNIVSTSQTPTDAANQYRAAKYTNSFTQNNVQQNQRAEINSVPSQQTSQGRLYASRLQTGNNGFNGNLQTNPNRNQIYSGQLYQFPVPDVTSQIYNAGSVDHVQSNVRQQNSEPSNLYGPNQNSNAVNNNNLAKQSSAEVEIVQSQTLPLPAAKLQFAPSNEAEAFNSQEHSTQALSFLNNGNGISAQLRDKIIGTLPHPLEENKRVTYKKDQSYYVYTHSGNVRTNVQSNNNGGQQNAKLIQDNISPNIVTFQFVPSVSYQFEDEKDQQKILNAFQIDGYGNPKTTQQDDRRQDNLSTDVDYSVNHSTSAKQLDGQFNDVNTLYNGPSSYVAPQASVGSLETRERVVQGNPNLRLEQFEENNNAGYSKQSPARLFTF